MRGLDLSCRLLWFVVVRVQFGVSAECDRDRTSCVSVFCFVFVCFDVVAVVFVVIVVRASSAFGLPGPFSALLMLWRRRSRSRR